MSLSYKDRMNRLGLFVCILFSFSLASAQDADTDQQIAEHLLQQSLKFYNSELRHQASGQYIDSTALKDGVPQENNSSVAATGMGLVALAIGDASGVFTDGDSQAIKTLSTILNPNYSKRHPQWGWFRHWFNATDGSDNNASRADGYSTIDTAILAAGAVLAANYFQATGKDFLGVLSRASDQLLKSVNWESAIADMNAGRLYLNYTLNEGTARGATSKFNEYVLVSCMGKLAEKRQGRTGRMTQFWNTHFANPSGLPKKNYDVDGVPVPLLTDFSIHYISSFTIQFAYYLCGEVNTDRQYIEFFKNAMRADRAWFGKQSVQRRFYWGHGAGEALNSSYAANAIGKNPDLIVSPHIVAGFLAENPELLTDLAAQYLDGDCVYRKNGLEVLWRCSLSRPEQRLNRLQAIDFSSMFLGLATIHPKIGKDFFKTYSP